MPSGTKLIGIGGWLVLPIIGFFGLIVMTIFNLIGAFQEIEGLKLIFSGSNPSLSGLILPTVLSLVFGVAVIASAAICLYRILVVGHGVVKFTTIHYAILFCAAMIDMWAFYALNAANLGDAGDHLLSVASTKTALYSILWGSYFLLSKRVRNTFEAPRVNSTYATVEAGEIDAPR